MYLHYSGGLEKKLKSYTSENSNTRGVNMKKRYCLKQLLYLDSIKNVCCSNSQLLIRGNRSSERSLLLRKLFIFFFSSFGVCFGIKVKRKRWTMLMFNLSDTGSISSTKLKLEDFYVISFLFCNWILSFRSQIPALKTLFLCCSVLEFSSFPHSGFRFVCQTWTL